MTYKKMENYVALQDHFLIEPTEDKLKSASGLVTTQLHDSVIDRPEYGIVMAIGPKVTMNLEIGDKVWWCYTRGIDLLLNGEKYTAMTSDSILIREIKK